MNDRRTSFGSADFSRRQVLKLAGLAGVATASPFLLAACGGGTAASGGSSFTYAGWGGVVQDVSTKAWLDPYMKAHPELKIIQDQPLSYAKIKAMVETNHVIWDVVTPASDFGTEQDAAYLEPLDTTIITTMDQMFSSVANTKWRVGADLFSQIYGYRTDQFPKGVGENGWADFYNLSKYPGKRGISNAAAPEIFQAAVLADGADPKNFIPIDLDRAFAKLDTIKSNLVWWNTYTETQQLLSSGEVSMVQTSSTRMYDLIVKQKAPVAVAWNQNLPKAIYFVVPKGSPNAKEAMRFIQYCTSAENNAARTEYSNDAPVNRGSTDHINPKMKPYLSTSYVDVAANTRPADEWWAKNKTTITDRYEKWKLS